MEHLAHRARAASALLALALLAVLIGPFVPSAVAMPSVAPTVVVVLAPYLTWDDVAEDRTPAIASLATSAAAGSVTVRAASAGAASSAARGAAILSAGRPVGEPGDAVEAPGAPVGGLGAAVLGAGGFTAAIGTSASDMRAAPFADTPALLLAGDSPGTVTYAAVRAAVVRADGPASGALVADLEGIEAAYREAIARRMGPSLIVIDPGDLTRASRAVGDPASRDAALASTDAVVAMVLRLLPSDAMLLVVSTAQQAVEGVSGLGPVVAYGAGEGMLYSAGTRTAGLVTLPDITATIAGALGVGVPAGTTGTAITVADDAPAGTRIARLRSADATARVLDALRVPSWALLGLGCAIPAAAGLIVLVRDRKGRAPATRPPRVGRVAALALVAATALPLGILLVRVGVAPETPGGAWARLALWCAPPVIVALLLANRRGIPAALGGVAAANALLIVGDQLVGGPLAPGSPLSYSVLYGTRFYGLGNEGAAVLLGALLVAVAWRVDAGRGTPRDFLIAGVLGVIVSVLPFLGANVGVAAWGTVAAVAAYLYASGRRMTWCLAGLMVLAVVVLLALALAIDALSLATSHLGQLVASIAVGEDGLVGTLGRKAGLALDIVRAAPVVLLVPLIAAGLLVLVARPRGPLGAVIRERRGFAGALAGMLVGGLVSIVTEDSGTTIAALLLFFSVSGLVALALDRRCAGPSGRRLEAP